MMDSSVAEVFVKAEAPGQRIRKLTANTSGAEILLNEERKC